MLRTTLPVAPSSSSTRCLSVCKPSMRSSSPNFSSVLINGDDTSASNSNNPSRRLTLLQLGTGTVETRKENELISSMP
ncbi:hypothetical protein SLEP1_g47435 [Rubroshorea leprosula]|uniref:Uncharacterized protein n=1 Tax=Rubroshorea leprosula TaxID=152421 RepID=A0AAV5LRE0_9ROSI|nr:hypothetical protein SLEP1_g47435 [Rubroshorea leprosula]